MTEITELNTSDALNTSLSGEGVSGSTNMTKTDNIFQAVMGLLARSVRTAVWRVLDSADPTKRLALDLSGIAANTTRTLTVPDKNGMIATTADVTAATTGFAQKLDTRRNRIVNHDMRMSQENGNAPGTTNGYSPADQWFLYFTTTGAGRSIQRVQSRTLSGGLDQLEYKCTSAKASLAAGDSELITQPLEGSNVADCAFGTSAAKPWVDRFQVQLPAGTYHMHYANSANNRHCAVPFTISGGEANTPIIKSVVVPADTSGTWLTADGVIGIVRDLVLAAGSTFTGGSASTWSGSAFYAAGSQANILASTSNVARLADVGLRLDPGATGVYGQYEVGEVDAVYRSERYVGEAIMTASVAAVLGGFSFSIPMAKTPILLKNVSAGDGSATVVTEAAASRYGGSMRVSGSATFAKENRINLYSARLSP